MKRKSSKKRKIFIVILFLSLALLCILGFQVFREQRALFHESRPLTLESSKIGLYEMETLKTSKISKATKIIEKQKIPLISKSALLPHDGLFVRRNNNFGTFLGVGIKDLIEEGVMIDQTKIRFDDFVAPKILGIPSPKNEESLCVNHGIAMISYEPKRDSRSTHYLEIALKASENRKPVSVKNSKFSVNYIFVVDSSGSMDGRKLDNVKSSISKIYDKLTKSDIIGIIKFSDGVSTVLKATKKKNLLLLWVLLNK